MIIKAIEIRDVATMIPAIAIKMEPANEAQRYLLARVGFRADSACVVVMRLTDQESTYDPHCWRGNVRTMPVAHRWLLDHFDEMADGDVVDVEYILGETAESKRSERDTT